MAKARLKELLNKYQGKDHKLERQKKLRKEAEKRKQKKNTHSAGDTNLDEDSDPDEEWEDASESLPSDAAGVRLADESDSESDEDENEDDEEEFQEVSPEQALNDEEDDEGGVDVEMNEGGEDDEDEDEHDDIALSDLSSVGSDLDDVVPHQRLTINNTAALDRALKSIALPLSNLPFSEHQSITSAEPTIVADVDDDLNRELAFYSQSLSAAKEARRLLEKEGVPFVRPHDYFAEMVKSDEHMDKIKTRLVEDASSKKAAAEARKQRDLKKFGKQVQQEKLKERAQAKNQMLEKVKLLKRKRQSEGIQTTGEEELFDVALEDAAGVQQQRREGAGRRRAGAAGAGAGAGGRRGDGSTGRNAKRQRKDEKFGFGGKKRFKKSGDAISSADMSGYSAKKMKGSGLRSTKSKLSTSKRRR